MIRIKEIRKEQGLNQNKVAEFLNISPGNLCDWEKGRTEPSIDFLIKLADLFNCSVDYLIGREDDFGNVYINSVACNLDAQEEELLQNFKNLSLYEQEAILIQVKALAEQRKKEKV